MDDEKLKLALGYAVDARKTEIGLLWSRSLYFWGFISVVLVAYGSAVSGRQFTLAFLAACVGLVLSLCWTLANRSSKYWRSVWEWKAESISEDLLRDRLFTAYHNTPVDLSRWWGPKQFSPSKLAMAVSDLITGAWICLLIAAVSQERKHHIWLDMLMFVATTAFGANVLRACRSGNAATWQQLWVEIKWWASAFRPKPPSHADL